MAKVKKTATKEINKDDFMVLTREEAQGIVDTLLEFPIKYERNIKYILNIFQEAKTLKQFEEKDGTKNK